MTSPNKTCLKCGAALAGDCALDVCPKCVAAHAFAETAAGPGADSPGPPEQLGESIGRYKLLQKIGEGGCGVVYMAEQEEPVRRRVALKVIKLGMDTRQVVARFEAERQALALMDHPNIAKVLDGGATDSGRPYFVMELVRGVRITDYCDDNNLSTSDRLNLFIQVCHAVQHAHQKGIIHRDLKPSNILVTINDGVPVPKVIDFGVAKATEQRLTDKTLFTEFHQFIGTPAYMSPEQALMTSLDIDTRSDIYSLGVLLYELLTSRTPLDTLALLKTGIDEMRRAIREQEPARPSARLSTLAQADLTTAARRRSTHPPQLIHAVDGDLDWIVMKCLEKDRTRRYETANGLAADIRRHLATEPVLARPPSTIYRLQKAFRRNRLAFSAAGCALAALCLGLSLAASQYVQKNKAFQRAQSEADKAQTEATKNAQIVRFLADTLAAAGPFAAQGRDTTLLRDILDRTTERLSTELNGQPDVEAFLLALLGNVYDQIGNLDKAEASFRRRLTLLQKQHGGDGLALAGAFNDLAGVLRWQGAFAEAERLAREALRIHKTLAGETNQEYAGLLSNLGIILEPQGKLEEAEQLARRAIQLKRKLGGPATVDTAMSFVNLGNVHLRLGKLAEAETAYREAAMIHAELLDHEINPGTLTLKTAALDNLSRVLEQQHRLDQAEQAAREALLAAKAAWGEDNPQFAQTMDRLVWLLTRQGKTNEADQVILEAIQRIPSNGTLWAIRSIWHARRGLWESAATYAAQALELAPADHLRYHKLAPLLAQTQDFDAYRKLCARAARQFHATADPNVAERMAKDCLILPNSGVDPLVIASWTDLGVANGSQSPDLPWFQFAKAFSEYRRGHFASAADWLQKMLAASGTDHQRDLLGVTLLSMAFHQLNDAAKAHESLKQAQALQAKLPSLEAGDLGEGWIDWIIAHLLLREARELIEKQANLAKDQTGVRMKS